MGEGMGMEAAGTGGEISGSAEEVSSEHEAECFQERNRSV